MSRIESLVARLRKELRLVGFPGAEGTARLVEHLGDRVRVREDPKERYGYCRHRKDGTTTIWVPLGATEILAHELGHHFCTVGRSGCTRFSCERLERMEHCRDEAIASRFARAWLLPRELLKGEEWEIAEEAGCSIAVVRQRLRDLRGE